MKYFSAALIACCLAGCVTTPKTTYYWGTYEQQLYAMYNKPGEAEPAIQIDKLTADIQAAEDAGKPVPPGVHAHLGMLYAMVGNAPQSEAAFLREKTLFPESTVLIDGMLQRAKEANK